ncbi:hypothetical protein ACJBWB_11895, partial [Streptococcus suis]
MDRYLVIGRLQQIIKNTLLFIKQLSKEGVDVVYKKPKTHIILVNLLNLNLSGKEAENLLFQHKILGKRPITRYIEKAPKSCRLWNLFLFTS